MKENENFEESNVEVDVINKFTKDAEIRGDATLLFDNYGGCCVFDSEGFNFTKVTGAKLISDGKEFPLEKISTWAGLLRSINNATKPLRYDEVSIESFNETIKDVIETHNLIMNQNFSNTLFEDDSFITSSLYKNNQNHALEVFDGKKICAVYSGEVVVVLNALIAACSGHTRLLISYNREYKKSSKVRAITNHNEKIVGANPFLGMGAFDMAIDKSLEDISGKIEDIYIEFSKLCNLYAQRKRAEEMRKGEVDE